MPIIWWANKLISNILFMNDHFNQLKAYVKAIHHIPEQDWAQFQSLWKPYNAKRKVTITAAGEPERYLYFVISGVQRVYFTDQNGREATLVFTYNPSFGGVLDAMLCQRPSTYWYETLSPSAFLRAPYADILTLAKSSPTLQAFIDTSLAGTISGLLRRMVELQCYNSKEKFQALLTRSPHIIQHVPHKYLASYLGIDATNFSKLFNTINI